MTTNTTADSTDDYSSNDRRTHNHLRSCFETACLITAPFLDKHQGLSGMPLKLSALQALRDHYPKLTQQDIAILFSTVQNYHGVRSRI
ncbi:MAG: hypothetical protein Q8K54_14510 [Gallionella sp.]|jgi:hypothetical protein|nr:hypothetical protein [Gallionella sp.]